MGGARFFDHRCFAASKMTKLQKIHLKNHHKILSGYGGVYENRIKISRGGGGRKNSNDNVCSGLKAFLRKTAKSRVWRFVFCVLYSVWYCFGKREKRFFRKAIFVSVLGGRDHRGRGSYCPCPFWPLPPPPEKNWLFCWLGGGKRTPMVGGPRRWGGQWSIIHSFSR